MSPLLRLASILFGFGVCSIDGVEYCLTETFHARCRHRNDVILMDSARFGRMELGRCVTRNFGHVGCAADVIGQLDAACSGRTYCDLSVSDPSLVRMKPCPKDFSAYLDALYHCVPVITSSTDECRVHGRHVVTNDNGYVSSSITSSTISRHAAQNNVLAPPSTSDDGVVTQCPFVFNLDPGQRLTLTLFDFALKNLSGHLPPGSSSPAASAAAEKDISIDGESSSESCLRYLVIDEPAIASSVTVCGGYGRHGSLQAATMTSSPTRRERHIYTSRTTPVHVHLLAPSAARFLVKFQVTGCYNPPWLPPDSHVKFHIDRLVVVCNHSGESFVLICVQENGRNQWIGELKNCSKPPGWSLAIVVGVAMVTVIYVAVVITCLLHIRRWRGRSRLLQQTKPVGHSKPEVTSPMCDAPTLITERTAMVGVKQTVYQTDHHGMTYSELFQLKPSSSPATSTVLRHCSKRDVKYLSPARLPTSTADEPTTLTSTNSSRVTFYDSPYCAWCYDDVTTSQCYTQATAGLQCHQLPAPPARGRTTDNDNDVDEIRRQREASDENCDHVNGVVGGNANDHSWLGRLVGQSRDAVMTSSMNQQRDILLFDEIETNVSGATSPDVIISASTCTAT